MKGASIMECITRFVRLDVSKGRIVVTDADWKTRRARYHDAFPKGFRDVPIALRGAGDRT